MVLFHLANSSVWIQWPSPDGSGILLLAVIARNEAICQQKIKRTAGSRSLLFKIRKSLLVFDIEQGFVNEFNYIFNVIAMYHLNRSMHVTQR